ncbi:MAG: HmuY family protein [Bacteroidales bacterium]|jgi:hypothetical protein|nr:HmuY family protein [Bacteroidales bacterium]
MLKKQKRIVLYSLSMLSVVLLGCEKPKEVEELKESKTLTVDATAYDKWVYVSFKDAKTVEITDYQNDLSWDMALHRYDVRLNGGLSGKGKGAALETSYTELSALTEIPAAGYTTDVMDSIMLAMPPVYDAQPFNKEASKWMSFDLSIMPPVYQMSDKVFVFKTAEGKHVKIKFIDYINAENIKGHIKFTYVFMD